MNVVCSVGGDKFKPLSDVLSLIQTSPIDFKYFYDELPTPP